MQAGEARADGEGGLRHRRCHGTNRDARRLDERSGEIAVPALANGDAYGVGRFRAGREADRGREGRVRRVAARFNLHIIVTGARAVSVLLFVGRALLDGREVDDAVVRQHPECREFDSRQVGGRSDRRKVGNCLRLALFDIKRRLVDGDRANTKDKRHGKCRHRCDVSAPLGGHPRGPRYPWPDPAPGHHTPPILIVDRRRIVIDGSGMPSSRAQIGRSRASY